MNEKALHILEFNKITEILSSFAGSEPAKRMCLNLRPSGNPEWIDHAQDETSAALSRLFKSDRLSFGANIDVRPFIKAASIGRTLGAGDLLAIAGSDHTIVQDRTIYEGVYVFVANNRDMGHLSERDYHTYMDLFDNMMEVVREPDLMIYLRASVPHLVSNIQKRGRGYEQTISLEYLQNLNRRYEEFIYQKYKGRVMTIEKDGIDFLNEPKDFSAIVDRIDATLFGLFPPESD